MVKITIQFAIDKSLVPTTSLLKKWAKHALRHKLDAAEVSLRLVDSEEMAVLNKTYRHKDGPTNVLSFAAALPNDIPMPTRLLGDIVICAPVVNAEASAQAKENHAHWAHIVIHGCLHLLGYDHENETDAAVMETLEIDLLAELGFANPY